MKVINKQMIHVNPHRDACTLYCPFLSHTKNNITYCTKYDTVIKILTYQPNNIIRRTWSLLKINIKRFMIAKGRYRTNRTFIPFEKMYYETVNKKTVRLYLRDPTCKRDYDTAEKIGYIVT